MKLIFKMFNTWTIIAYIFILLGGVGAIILGIQQTVGAWKDSQKNMDAHQQTINTITEEKNKLNSTLKVRDKKIEKQNEKIDILNSELLKKSNFIEKYISGGDGYPIIKLSELPNIDNKKQTKLKLNLVNEFQLPLYNTHVEVYNFDLIKSKWFNIFPVEDKFYMNPSDYDSCRITLFNNDLLYPGSNVDGIFLIPTNEYNLFIKIHSRSKLIIEKLTVYHHENTFYYAIEIYDIYTNKLIRSDYNKNAPKEVQKILKQRLKSIPTNLGLHLIE